MIGEAIGYVLLKKDFEFTSNWSDNKNNFVAMSIGSQRIESKKTYKELLSGQMVSVMEESVDKKEYLILGKGENDGRFLWMIDKKDTVENSFLPVKRVGNFLVSTNLTPVDELIIIAQILSKLNKTTKL